MGQDLAGGRQRAQLDVGVQSGIRGQAQQGDVVPEVLIHVSNRRNAKQLGKDTPLPQGNSEHTGLIPKSLKAFFPYSLWKQQTAKQQENTMRDHDFHVSS